MGKIIIENAFGILKKTSRKYVLEKQLAYISCM
jgi:hypothetical protein